MSVACMLAVTYAVQYRLVSQRGGLHAGACIRALRAAAISRNLINWTGVRTITMEALLKTEAEISIKAPWGNMAALSWGDRANPPVLLCHGKLDVASSFRPLVSLLPTSFFYVSLDLPGNGRSDHLPSGVRYSVADLVPSILSAVKHFKWKRFIYIGHSLGVPIGKLFNIIYPGYISRTVELDPIPAHESWPSTRIGLYDWYLKYYSYYDDEKYAKLNGGPETAPKYTYEKALELTMSTRQLTREATEHILERCLIPVDNGLYRFSFDQRMKNVTLLPFSPEILTEIYVTTDLPTFCVIAKKIMDSGYYKHFPYLLNEDAWPNRNYKVKVVDGWHDVHISDPQTMAVDISTFLMEDIKAKL